MTIVTTFSDGFSSFYNITCWICSYLIWLFTQFALPLTSPKGTSARENSNIIWFSSHLFVPLQSIMATKRAKHTYLQLFGVVVMVLALVRCIFPGVAVNTRNAAAIATDSVKADNNQSDSEAETAAATRVPSTGHRTADDAADGGYQIPATPASTSAVYVADGSTPHPIRSVHSYAEAFPDSNHVQLVAARYWGVPPVKNRNDAEQRKDELVFVGASPYYSIAHLDASIPYLVPRASLLLDDIGRIFFDSLQVKGLPLHRLVVSSVLRTQDDVSRLRRSNTNATEHSCHLYGTTFDINYNQYEPVNPRRETGSDKLKWVLSEVLNDMRQQNRCYIKYEVRQPCFHITVR